MWFRKKEIPSQTPHLDGIEGAYYMAQRDFKFHATKEELDSPDFVGPVASWIDEAGMPSGLAIINRWDTRSAPTATVE